MAANANSADVRFSKKYPDLVKEVQHKFIDYVKLLQHPCTVVPARTTQTPTAVQRPLETEKGYPKVPYFLPEDKVTKDQAEGIMRRYLTAEYSGYR
jgi:hypothetical protein